MSGELKTAIIGAGKIAYTVAAALYESGSTPSLIISRSINSAESLAYAFSVPRFSDMLSGLSGDINAVIISTPDNEIENTAKSLSALDLPFKKQLYLHLSGSFGTELLDSLKSRGAMTGSLHIMQSFPNKIPQNIKGMLAAVEHTTPAALKKVKQLCSLLGVEPFTLKPGTKNYYHSAGVFASNFLIGNLHASMAVAKSAGIEEEMFNKLFMRITEATLKNAASAGIDAALSGPVERNDITTVENHIRALKKRKEKEAKAAVASYIIQSLMLTEAAAAKNPEMDYSSLRKMLQKELNH